MHKQYTGEIKNKGYAIFFFGEVGGGGQTMCEMGDVQMANCYFASDVTATMLVDKNKRVSLPWELNAFCVQIQRKKFNCFINQHDRLAFWMQKEVNCSTRKSHEKLQKK